MPLPEDSHRFEQEDPRLHLDEEEAEEEDHEDSPSLQDITSDELLALEEEVGL